MSLNAIYANEPIITSRLHIRPLSNGDTGFILQLLNTEGWIRFIGDRNIRSISDAAAYIERILSNNNIAYWVARLKEGQQPAGIITYIKRDYLEHPDIGFAFLPEYAGKGYAYEATRAVLAYIIKQLQPSHIMATTKPENTASINLLRKLGFSFQQEIPVQNEKLGLYGAPAANLKSSLTQPPGL